MRFIPFLVFILLTTVRGAWAAEPTMNVSGSFCQLKENETSPTCIEELRKAKEAPCREAKKAYDAARSSQDVKSGCAQFRGDLKACVRGAKKCSDCVGSQYEDDDDDYGAVCSDIDEDETDFAQYQGSLTNGVQLLPDKKKKTVNRLLFANCPAYGASQLKNLRDKREKYKDKKDDLEKDILTLNSEAKQAQSDREAANARLEQLKKEKQTQLNDELQESADKLISDSEELLSAAKDAQAKISELKLKIQMSKLDEEREKYIAREGACHEQAIKRYSSSEGSYLVDQQKRVQEGRNRVQSFAVLAKESRRTWKDNLEKRALQYKAKCMQDSNKMFAMKDISARRKIERDQFESQIQQLESLLRTIPQKLEKLKQDAALRDKKIEARVKNEAEKEALEIQREITAAQNTYSSKTQDLQQRQAVLRDTTNEYNYYAESEHLASLYSNDVEDDNQYSNLLSVVGAIEGPLTTAIAECNCEGSETEFVVKSICADLKKDKDNIDIGNSEDEIK